MQIACIDLFAHRDRLQKVLHCSSLNKASPLQCHTYVQEIDFCDAAWFATWKVADIFMPATSAAKAKEDWTGTERTAPFSEVTLRQIFCSSVLIS